MGEVEVMSERLLRLLFIPGKIHTEDFTFSPPYLAEIVSINGVERIRYYDITSTRTQTPFVHKRSHRLRAVIVHEWERLTGERLTSDFMPVAARRNKS